MYVKILDVFLAKFAIFLSKTNLTDSLLLKRSEIKGDLRKRSTIIFSLWT